MRIYLAGVRDPRAKRVCAELGARNYLLSFANQRAFDRNSDVLENPQCRVMVDSGAFSVWNTGRKIDVKKYADFAHKLMARARCELIFVNLDVIPGRRNAPASSYERDISSEQSFRNWQYLRAQDVPSMGVFHQHERFYWLDVLKKHSGYIGISPANDVSLKKRDIWLSEVFRWIGLSVRTHGPCFCTSGFKCFPNIPNPLVVDEKWLAYSTIENGQEPGSVCTEKVPSFTSSEAP